MTENSRAGKETTQTALAASRANSLDTRHLALRQLQFHNSEHRQSNHVIFIGCHWQRRNQIYDARGARYRERKAEARFQM